MVDNFDDRVAKRISLTTPLQVTDLTSGDIFEAKMLDYSENGISFASDGFFEKDTPVFFGILYPPDYVTSRILEYYKGTVMWRKDSKQSPLSYEYGIQLASESSKQDSNVKDAKTTKDTYNGSTKNISASGIFIATNEKLKVGQLLQLNLPLKKGEMVGIVGQIVWINDEGFGLKFRKIK